MKKLWPILLIAFVPVAAGQEPAKPKAAPPAPAVEAPSIDQARIAKQYKDLEYALMKIAQKMEKQGGAENRQRAQIIYKALAAAREKQIALNLGQLADLLKKPELKELQSAMEKGTGAEADMKVVLELLLTESKDAEILKQLIELLKLAIHEQAVAIARTQSPNVDKADALNAQKKASERVKRVEEALEKHLDKSKPKDSDKAKPKEGDPSKQPGKPGDPKDSKDSKDSKGKGEPKKGEEKPSKGGQSPPMPGEGEPGKSGEPPPPGEQQEAIPGRQRIKDAQDDQKKAEENIDKDQRKQAVENQEDAKKKLEELKKQWEEILRQMREEEIERLLAALRERCEKMLRMQIVVYEQTKQLDGKIQKFSNKKPTREEEVAARGLSDQESLIVGEADKAIELLKEEGTAVAFAEVFRQVRNDMTHVAQRLGRADVAAETQVIEEDIIATLKEMIEALKKAQQDQENRRNPPPGSPPPNANQPLIDLIAELKMIRTMQVRVNQRTLLWGKRYPGEQAQVPEIVTELKDLGQRQGKIYEVTTQIAKGKNR